MSSKRAAAPRTYITIADAATRTAVDPRTIRRRIADGTLNAYKLGPRLIRIDPDELDKLVTPIPTAGDAA